MNGKNVLVIGRGVAGLTTALKLVNAGHKVTIWSKEADDQFPRTSYNAYAMWVPVAIGADPRIERWNNETFTELEKRAADPDTGVVMRQVFILKTAHSEPWFAGKFAGFRHPKAGEISDQYPDAHVLDKAPVVDPTVYLPWLQKQVQAAGGTIEQHDVTTLAGCPSKYSVIVNCSGLEARTLAGDKGVFPSRLQVVTIKPNGFDKVVFDDEGPNKRACIVAHRDYIKLGAVFDERIETLETEEKHTLDILERCRRMVPGFKADRDDVISVTRALRPEREGWLICVEQTALDDGRTVIQNYGHDGMGFCTLDGIGNEIVGYLS